MTETNKNFQIEITDWSDTEYLNELMEKYGDTTDAFYGHNEDGESISISIFPDVIINETLQSNGWIRKNYFYPDGTCEEIFVGKWL